MCSCLRACMHACIHVALLGAERDPATRTFQSVRTRPRGERGRGSKSSVGNSANLRGIHLNVDVLGLLLTPPYPLCSAITQTVALFLFFQILPFSALETFKSKVEASYDCVLSHTRVSLLHPRGGGALKMFHLERVILSVPSRSECVPVLKTLGFTVQ